MDFARINKVGKLAEFLPVKKMTELEVGGEYKIVNLRTARTTWGPRIAVDLENRFTCFLPVRFVKAFEEDDASFQQKVAAAHANKLVMLYLGGRFNNLEFKLAAE